MTKPDPKNHGNFLKRVVGAARKQRRRSRDEIPPERLERWAQWWELHIMGLSPAKIAARNKGRFTVRQVQHGLTQYAELAADPLVRQGRLTRSVHLTNLLKAKAIEAAHKIEAEARANGGLPKRTVRDTTDANGNVVRVEQLVHERADREVRDWLRLALDCEKYLATLHGILALHSEQAEVDVIDVTFDEMLLSDSVAEEADED